LAVTIMGLGLFGGGVGAASYFAHRGAHVTVTDLKRAEALAPSLEALEGLDITFHLGGHQPADFTEADVVVVSPAVPKTSPYLAMAAQAAVPVTSEMNLFVELCPAVLVGVTGSSGKSTTTALVGDMLTRFRPTPVSPAVRQSEVWRPPRRTRVGGNIGKSLLDEVHEMRADETVVLELSSFQLEDLAAVGRSPYLAVVTCISPNHLDRHGSMGAYIAAKKNILKFQGPKDVAVLNADDAEVRTWKKDARGRVVFYSVKKVLRQGAFLEGMQVVFRLGGAEERVDLTGRVRLRGKHNLANVLAAATVARLLGVPLEAIASAVEAFRPLVHRLQVIGRVGDVLFVDDSKATTPESARVAIEAFEEDIVLIAGGYDKHVDPEVLLKAIRTGTRAVVLMGATAEALARALEGNGPPIERAKDMDDAVRRAARLAQAGDVVLLSPGHASWDMFDSFEHRGDAFRRTAEALGLEPVAAENEREGGSSGFAGTI
jgi:UDP-N-acetylmuramoylalanine--D-glutamate ligase